MPILTPKLDPRAVHLRFEGGRLVVDLADGRTIAVPLSWYPRLGSAAGAEREHWRLIGGGQGIHWSDIDEDLSIAGMLYGIEATEPMQIRSAGSEYLRPASDARGAVDRPYSVAAIRRGLLTLLESRVGNVQPVKGTRSIYILGRAKTNIRTTSPKRGDAYWFDVTPSYYQYGLVDFFIYACGQPDHSFVFSRREMSELAEASNRGGSKLVPHFTLHVDTREFEPGGAGGRRIDISRNFNDFGRVKSFVPAA